LLALLACLVGSCTAVEPVAVATLDPAQVRAARELCPVLWEWQQNVGAAMNEMSSQARDQADPGERRVLYRRAAARIRELNAQLEATVRSLASGSPLDIIVPDVAEGIIEANALLDGYEEIIDEKYDLLATPGYGDVVPALFMNVEKVIDVAKPEMATYGDPGLVDAFITVPQCHVGVKDANDGSSRYIP
jgi:hypothetical protein